MPCANASCCVDPDRYTMVPFPAKALKVLLNDLLENFESSMGKAGLRSFPGVGNDEITDETLDSDDDVSLRISLERSSMETRLNARFGRRMAIGRM